MKPLDYLGKLDLPDYGTAPDGSRWVLSTRAISLLGVSVAQFDELVDAGRLECFCPCSGRRVVSELDLLTYLDRHRLVRSKVKSRLPGEHLKSASELLASRRPS